MLTAEQIAEIATKAALAAVQAATAGAPTTPAKQAELPDDEADEAAARLTIEENERHYQGANELADKLLPMIMAARHREVFQWLARSRGVSEAELMRQVLRAEVARETPNWREAQGMGGSSTKNAATMARLRGE